MISVILDFIFFKRKGVFFLEVLVINFFSFIGCRVFFG